MPDTKNTLQVTGESYPRSVTSVNKFIKEITDKDLLNSFDDNFGYPRDLSYLHKLNNIVFKESFFDVSVERLSQLKILFEDFIEIFLDATLPDAKNTFKMICEPYIKLICSVQELEKEITDKDLLILQENLLFSRDSNFSYPKTLFYLHEFKNIALKEFFHVNAERLSQLKILYVNLDLQDLLKERRKKRNCKNWVESDRLRKMIYERGYKIVDNKDGSSILVKRI